MPARHPNWQARELTSRELLSGDERAVLGESQGTFPWISGHSSRLRVVIQEDGLRDGSGYGNEKGPVLMKMMSCRQLGGPCDLVLQGKTADEVIKAQDRHLRESVRAGDVAHEAAHEEMRRRWRRPVAAMGWYRDTKRAFAELPDA